MQLDLNQNKKTKPIVVKPGSTNLIRLSSGRIVKISFGHNEIEIEAPEDLNKGIFPIWITKLISNIARIKIGP